MPPRRNAKSHKVNKMCTTKGAKMQFSVKDKEEILQAIREAMSVRCKVVACRNCKLLPEMMPTSFVMDAGVYRGEGRRVYEMGWRPIESGWASIEVGGKYLYLCPSCTQEKGLIPVSQKE